MANLIAQQGVPLSSQLVNENARPLITHSNPQTQNPPFPVLLSDQITLQSGTELDLRSEAFTNNLTRPIELRSMRVLITMVAEAGVIVQGGSLIALSMSLDDTKLTRGSTTVGGLCRSDNRMVERWSPLISQHAWFFSQPVPILPGHGLKITAKHLGMIRGAATVSIAFAGRVSPKPVPRRIPYVMEWTSRSFAYDEAGVDSSPPAALSNDTRRDFVVDRIIGRSTAYDDAALAVPGVTEDMTDFADYTLQGITAFRLRMGASMARPILKTFTPWRAIFGQNAALETDFVLRAGDYVIADVQHLAGAVIAPALGFSQNRASLSLIGWREV